MPMPDITDFHTHNLEADNAIISVPEDWVRHPAHFAPRNGAWYAVGIHPWWTADAEGCRQMWPICHCCCNTRKLLCWASVDLMPCVAPHLPNRNACLWHK